MVKEFKLPELGENIESADVTRVMIKAGDKVEVDQTIMEIETDKATVEVPSTLSGTVKEVSVKPGDKAKVGQVIFVIDDSQSNGQSKEETKKQPEQKPAEQNKEKPEAQAPAQEKPKEIPKAEAEISPKSEQKGNITDFILPALGENIESAKVVQVKVKEGDKVEKDQIILEIETDKATIEVPSDISGIVRKVNVKEGENAKVGQAILTLESQDRIAETEGEMTKSKRLDEEEKGGAEIKESQVPSAEEVAEKVKEEKPVKKEVEAKKEEAQPAKPKIYIEEKPSVDPGKLAPAAPTVRRFAREIGVDINKVSGTGPGGRISIPDVKAYARELSRKQAETKESRPEGIPGIFSEPLPDFKKWGTVDVKEMSNIRRKTAEHLSYAWVTIPHVTQYDKADITDLEKLRKTFTSRAEAAGGKLTVTAILLKVIASALKTFPQFNASVDMANSSIIYKKYYHIGVAVDTDRGLLVPVVRDVDKKNIIEISAELNTFAEKARNRKLSLEEMQGGTFTITNLGGIGGTYFSPIINSPEVAILGVSRGNFEPVYIDGKFEPRLMLPLSLSYDHRIIDGADAIRFLRWVVNALQQPFLLALEG